MDKSQYMTVKRLIGLLEQCDPDMVVIASSDSEGNSYGMIADVDDTGLYDPQNHSIVFEELDPDLKRFGLELFDPEKGHVKAVILWPDQ